MQVSELDFPLTWNIFMGARFSFGSSGSLNCTVFFLFLVGYVEERLWLPIQSPNKGRKKKANS